MRFGRIHPPSRKEQFHRDMPWDAFGKFQGRRIRNRSGIDLGQSKCRMLCGEDDVSRQSPLQPAAATDPVHRRDHRFIEIGQLL